MSKVKYKENDNQNRKMVEFYKRLDEKDLQRLIEIEESKIRKQTNNN